MTLAEPIVIKSSQDLIGWAGTKSNPIPILKQKARQKLYKTSKAARDAMAKARKKIKLPMVAGTIIFGPTVFALANTTQYGLMRNKVKGFATEMIHNYTGVRLDLNGRYLGWDWQRPAFVYGSLIGLVADAKVIGARAYANRVLGRHNVPVFRL